MVAGEKRKHTVDDDQRIATLSRVNASRRSLSHVLSLVRDQGLPESVSRSKFQRARHAVAETTTPYGRLLQSMEVTLADGTPDTVYVQAPLPMLSHLAATSHPFCRLLAETYRNHPCEHEAWSIILYNDEVSPTNPLKSGVDNRKVEVYYWSFAQFGPLLANDSLWFVLTCIRSLLAHKVEDGMSSLVRMLLNTFFFNQEGTDLGTAGVTIQLADGSPMHIVANLDIILADIPALKQTISWKGFAARVPCFCCKNIYSKTAASRQPREARALSITSVDFAQMVPHSDLSVRNTFQQLIDAKAAGISATALRELETKLGWSFCAHPLLMDTRVCRGVVSTSMFDWMHVYCVNGLVSDEVALFMREMKAKAKTLHVDPITFDKVHTYMQTWRWPRALASAHNLCNSKSAHTWQENNSFGGTASEQLSFLPVFRRFTEAVISKSPLGLQFTAEITSMLALADVVDCLQAITRDHVVGEDHLYQLIATHLHAYRSAYGEDNMMPKHHYSIHLPKQMQAHGRLFACFVHERRHQEIRKHTMQRRTLTGYEAGLMEEVICDNIADMMDLDLWREGGLVEPVHQFSRRMHSMLCSALNCDEDEDLKTAAEMVMNRCRFMKGDVVLVRTAALQDWPCSATWRSYGCAEVWFHLLRNGTLYTCIAPWPVVSEGDRDAVLRMEDSPLLVPSYTLLAPLMHMRTDKQSCLALLPYQFRASENNHHTNHNIIKIIALASNACEGMLLRAMPVKAQSRQTGALPSNAFKGRSPDQCSSEHAPADRCSCGQCLRSHLYI